MPAATGRGITETPGPRKDLRRFPGSATNCGVTTGAGDSAGETATASGGGWQEVRADDSIQYAPVEIPPRNNELPQWLEDFFEWLGDLLRPLGEGFGLTWPVFKWILVGLAVLGVLVLLWRLLAPVFERPHSETEEDDDWTPQRAEALALLEDADRLAGEGRYDEATHLLLQRSVGQIAAARPDWVEPSSTARELAALPALPDAARHAFATIAERVERSLFALRRLGRDDWQAARDAYAEFALQQLPARFA